jgi:hypothetical protein
MTMPIYDRQTVREAVARAMLQHPADTSGATNDHNRHHT